MRSFKYDYYKIELPSDAFPLPEVVGVTQHRLMITDQAFYEAKERTKLYCVPAEWTASIDEATLDNSIIVVNVRRRRNSNTPII